MSTINNAFKTASSIESGVAIASKDSLRKMSTDKEVKRANGYNADPRLLWIEDGFNIREIDESHVEGFIKSYQDGKYVPPIEVRVVEVDNKRRLKVIEGHHRTVALYKLLDDGVNIETVPVVEMSGNDIDQLTRMIKSTEGKPLTAVELAHAYRRMEKLGLTKGQIAEEVGSSPAHINNIMLLLNAPQELKNMVQNGDYPHSLAIANIRTHGPDLALVMAKEDDKVNKVKENAKNEGKRLSKSERTSSFRKMNLPHKKVQTLTSVATKIANSINVEELVDSENVSLTIDTSTAMRLLELAEQIKEIDDHNISVDEKMKEAVENAIKEQKDSE